MVTLAEIREYGRTGHTIRNLWAKWTFHQIANCITWLCIKKGVSANQISILSGIVQVAGCVLLAFGNYQMTITGAALVLLYMTLDFTDGSIARITKTTSEYGHFLDLLFGFTLVGVLPLCIGLGLYIKTGIWLWLLVGGVCTFVWYLGTTLIYLHDAATPNKLQTPGSSTMDKWYIAQPEVPVLVICASINYLEAFLGLFTAMYIVRLLGLIYATRKEYINNARKTNI